MAEMGKLDRSIGLEYCGMEELYEEVLLDFYKLIDTKVSKIRSLKAEGNIKDYTIEVHALKSTARMIGATELSELALEMEMAGKAGDTALIDEKNELLMQMYLAYKETLSYFDNNEAEKSDASEDEIRKCLDKMLAAADEFDMDAVDESMKQLNAINMPSAVLENMVKQLDLFVRDVAFDEIKDLIGKMTDLL